MTSTPPKIWIIGSAPECDVVVARPTVSGTHCRLVKIGDKFYLDDLQSTNGTFVNGTRVVGRTAVKRTDEIRLGSNAPFSWPIEPTASPEARPARTLLESSGPARPVDFAPTPRSGSAPPPSHPAVSERASPLERASLLGRVLTIGRESGNDIVLPYPMISSRHAQLTLGPGAPILVDLGSTNGTFVNARIDRITRATISPHDVIYFGTYRVPAARLLDASPSVGERKREEFAFSGDEIVFGRHPSCQQRLDYPMVSQRHARLFRRGEELLIEDLGSANGTFVNGAKIARPVSVRRGDTIGLGSFSFRLTADGRFEKRDCRGDVTIEARGVCVDVPGKRLIEDLSLTIYPSEFVGLMGPSGAGKTTLMNALNGYVCPTSGSVLFNGQNLYLKHAQFASHLGYVPQDDIIHRDLTVGQALYYTARLRLPPDTTDTEIDGLIGKTLTRLGLEGARDVPIGSPEKKGISGGQRKRVNLAMELLTDPSVLFLDEPTSGLSSEDALMVMKLLRDLADSGKAILLTIHQPSLEAFQLMDNLVLVGKDQNAPDPGALVYYGPAYPEAVRFFNPAGVPGLKPGTDPSPDEVLRGFARRPAKEWRTEYRNSAHHREFVIERAGKAAPSGEAEVGLPEPRASSGIRQWLTLARRCLTIKAKDRWNTAILLAQAPIVAILIVLVFGKDVSQNVTDANWLVVSQRLPITIFLMGLSALWFGCSNAAREIVGEWAIYHRERMVNLKIPSYVFSKVAVLGLLCLLQCATLVGIVRWGCALEGGGLASFLSLSLVSLVGISLGLLLSSLAKTSEVAIALLPIILLPMVILGGVLQPLHKMRAPIRALSQAAPSRWAFESMLLSETSKRPKAPNHVPIEGQVAPISHGGADRPSAAARRRDMAEEFFPAADRWGTANGVIVLAGMAAILLIAVHLVLRYRDVH